MLPLQGHEMKKPPKKKARRTIASASGEAEVEQQSSTSDSEHPEKPVPKKHKHGRPPKSEETAATVITRSVGHRNVVGSRINF